MITKKKQDEIERERSERENVRGGEREREREGKAAREKKREKKKVTLGGVPKKKHKNVKRPLNPINNSQWENPFENPGASAP